MYRDRNEPNGNKLRTYILYKNVLSRDFYVKNILNRQHRKNLANFRSGCLPLAIETGRYTRPKTPLEQRFCIYCKNICIEDEKHFLLNCDFYSDLRFVLMKKASDINHDFIDLDLQEQFVFIMTNDQMQPVVAKTLYDMFNRRKNCII